MSILQPKHLNKKSSYIIDNLAFDTNEKLYFAKDEDYTYSFIFHNYRGIEVTVSAEFLKARIDIRFEWVFENETQRFGMKNPFSGNEYTISTYEVFEEFLNYLAFPVFEDPPFDQDYIDSVLKYVRTCKECFSAPLSEIQKKFEADEHHQHFPDDDEDDCDGLCPFPDPAPEEIDVNVQGGAITYDSVNAFIDAKIAANPDVARFYKHNAKFLDHLTDLRSYIRQIDVLDDEILFYRDHPATDDQASIEAIKAKRAELSFKLEYCIKKLLLEDTARRLVADHLDASLLGILLQHR